MNLFTPHMCLPPRRGFSAIEMVVAISLFLIIVVTLANVLLGFYTLYAVQQAKVDTAYAAQTDMQVFARTAVAANSLVASHTFSGVNYATGASGAVFQLPTVNVNGDIVSGTYDYIAIVASGTAAYIITDPGTTSTRARGSQQIAGALSALLFTYDTSAPALARMVDADVTTQQTVKGKTVSAHLHQTIYLRNH